MIGAVDHIPVWIEEIERLPVVVQATGVDEIGCDRGDGRVIGSLQQEEPVRRDHTLQMYRDVSLIGQPPALQIQGGGTCIE